ncbi:MAG: RNA polymerase sigma-70 factor [candidate division KSB1 bacterium]|nr:RNA polymerase sigma-70 factor [candidate division KSB1 bacterium]
MKQPTFNSSDEEYELELKKVEKLFKKYYDSLIHYAYRYVNDISIAEDIIQDIFFQLWKNRHSIRFGVNIKTYLFNSVKNNCLKYLDRKKTRDNYKMQQVEIEYDIYSPDHIMLRKEMQESVQQAVNSLPPKRYEIFCMSRFDGLSYREIASILDISIKTVETQISRALKVIRKRVKF